MPNSGVVSISQPTQFNCLRAYLIRLNARVLPVNHITELFKFRKALFNVDKILNTASELRYTGEIKKFLAAQWGNP
jgi:hypothetical protein